MIKDSHKMTPAVVAAMKGHQAIAKTLIGRTGETLPKKLGGSKSLAHYWVPNQAAPDCTNCKVRFTFTNRRYVGRGASFFVLVHQWGPRV